MDSGVLPLTARVMPSPADGVPATDGLTSQEAERRLQQFGPNDPTPRRRSTAILDLLRLFLNPLVLILLIAAVLFAFLGEGTDAGIIVAIVLPSIIIDFGQTYRSRRAVEQLQKCVAAITTVMRDGHWAERPRRRLVPGDVVQLSAGDLVPADARLLTSRHLYLHQAALTGESLPVEKQANGSEVSARPDAGNMIFLGTSVVSGTATGRGGRYGGHNLLRRYCGSPCLTSGRNCIRPGTDGFQSASRTNRIFPDRPPADDQSSFKAFS